MNRLAFALVPFALVAGCAPRGETSRESPGSGKQDPLVRYEGDFRPSDHDTLAATRPKSSAPYLQPGRDSIAAGSAAEGDGELVQGFRVQIFSTTDIDQANAKKEEAESDFPSEWFYLQYDPPTYKIRGGNFIHRYEAERFARLAVEKGFADSWSVPEKVLKQPPAR